jgi:hypothetical protein
VVLVPRLQSVGDLLRDAASIPMLVEDAAERSMRKKHIAAATDPHEESSLAFASQGEDALHRASSDTLTEELLDMSMDVIGWQSEWFSLEHLNYSLSNRAERTAAVRCRAMFASCRALGFVPRTLCERLKKVTCKAV